MRAALLLVNLICLLQCELCRTLSRSSLSQISVEQRSEFTRYKGVPSADTWKAGLVYCLQSSLLLQFPHQHA